MRKLSKSKFGKALQINEHLAQKSPTIDFDDRSSFGTKLMQQLQEWPDGSVRGDEEPCQCDFCKAVAAMEPEFEADGCVNLISFQETSKGSGKWRSLVVPKDLLGMGCVVYREKRVEVWRHWTENTPRQLVAVFDWDDPKLFDKVPIAATEDICADWPILA